MKRWMFFIYAIVCYLLFLAVYAYMCGFVGDFIVPKSINGPADSDGDVLAMIVNVALLLAFGWSHSIMARPAFKRQWTRFVPQPIERSTYVLVSCIMLALLMWQWRPMPAIVWSIENAGARTVMWALFATGWLMVPLVSLMISHFDLFGVRHAWLFLNGRPYEPLPFRTPLLYSRVRHPLYIGWGLAFWATPTMSVGHLLFASILSVYMAIATLVEERDLIAHFGEEYLQYRRMVPRFIPRLRAASSTRAGGVEMAKNVTDSAAEVQLTPHK